MGVEVIYKMADDACGSGSPTYESESDKSFTSLGKLLGFKCRFGITLKMDDHAYNNATCANSLKVKTIELLCLQKS